MLSSLDLDNSIVLSELDPDHNPSKSRKKTGNPEFYFMEVNSEDSQLNV